MARSPRPLQRLRRRALTRPPQAVDCVPGNCPHRRRGNDAPRRHVLGDDDVRADFAIVADRDAAQNLGARIDHHAVPERRILNRTASDGDLLINRHIAADRRVTRQDDILRMVHAEPGADPRMARDVDLRNESEAQELAQDVFIQVLRRLPQVRQPERFGGWLRSVVNRMAIEPGHAAPGRCAGLIPRLSCPGGRAGRHVVLAKERAAGRGRSGRPLLQTRRSTCAGSRCWK